MTSPAKDDSAPATAGMVCASVVGASGTSYAMYDAIQLSVSGAFLRGRIFLELEEEFIVELVRGDASVRVRARVDSLDRGETPGMKVTFVGLGSADRNVIANELAGD